MLTQISIPLLTTVFLLTSGTSAIGQAPPPPPPHSGEPSGRGQGGGTRSPDCERYETVTALVPIVQMRDQSVHWGQTTATHPTIWLSAPQGLADGTPIEFTLRDDAEQIVHQFVQYTNAAEAGSFSLTPAATSAPLEVGKTYRWAVSISCNTDTPDVPIYIEGYVQRIAPLTGIDPSTDLIQQATSYARADIWYDALMLLGNQYLQNPTSSITDAWLNLLQQASLDQLPNTPIGSCCRAESE